ncbi:MAG: endonuclease VII domain-containing protein [Thermoplasmata archaeon]|nr:endonuclease VII domain-containing protein [Thermoplasmata archaeon]
MRVGTVKVAEALRVSLGVSWSEIELLWKRQNFRCAICREAKPLVLDHDHKLNVPRGLLCYRCNTMLGYLDGDEGAYREALNYVVNPPAAGLYSELSRRTVVAP